MTPWQRRLRLGLGIFVVALASILGVSLCKSRRPAVVPPLPTKADPEAIVESTSGGLVRALGARQDLSIEHYDKLQGYADGRTRITGGRFKILQRGGRDFSLRARVADINGTAPSVDVTMTGAVEMVSSDGLTVRTEQASYVNADGLLRAPGAVQFERGRMRGTAIGLTYDKARDVLSLLDKVVIHTAPDEKGEGGTDIEAGTVGFARADKYTRFERGVKIVGQGQTIEAETAVAFLTPDEKRIQTLELRGRSSVKGAPRTDGGLEGMTARDIDLIYAPDGRTLRRSVLSGDGVITLGASAGSARRKLSGQFIDLGLAQDGTTLVALNARDRVRLELFADKTTPARTIKANALQGSGPPSTGLTGATFNGGVEFLETPAAPGTPRLAFSSTLDLTMKNGFGSLETARFGGGTRFEQGGMTATARDARYGMAAGTLNLSGLDDRTGRVPQVVDERATIQAKRIDVALDSKKITAADTVKTESRGRGEGTDARGGQRAGDAAQGRGSGLIHQDAPAYAIADTLNYDSATSLAVYKGNAQVWQGDTTIKGDTVVVDDQKGDLSASGRVVSKMVLERVDPTTKAKEQVRSVATAREMVYVDGIRRATYTGDARLNGPEGDLAADRIEVYLAEGCGQIERLEGYGAVTIRTPEGRKATGVRLTYLAATDEYEITGSPATYEDESGETTGNSLTFSRSTDRIVVDGKGLRRTELKRIIKS
jgi:lipopolysaccharide export system protein LptA/urease beta subunit